MYNLAKLLIDEPHKLERLIIILLKLLITFHVTGLFFGFNLSAGSIIENPIPKNVSAIQIIYFFVVVTAVWFVLWGVIADLVLYEVLIGLLSRIGKDRDVFIATMAFVGVATEKNGRLISKGNIISFTNSLDKLKDDSTLEESQSRIKEYYLLTVISYAALLLQSNICLSKMEIIIGAVLTFNLTLGAIIITKFNAYISKNLDLINREFQPLSYANKIIDAIAEIRLFQNFESPHKGRKIVLKRKEGYDKMPETLRIIPAFHWNTSLGQKLLLHMILNRKKKSLNENSYDIILTNLLPNADIVSGVESQTNLALIHANDEKAIFLGLEEWIHIRALNNSQSPSTEPVN